MIVKYNTSKDFRFNICREGDWQAGTCHTDTSTKELIRVDSVGTLDFFIEIH